jgi:outer membrane protein assembly factor BamB
MKFPNRRWLTRLLIPLALISLTATGLKSTDFPQWRGPNRDGHSPEIGLLQEWPTNGPKLLWQVNHLGAGYSTPAIVGDRIYLLSNEGSEESVIALSTTDGSRIWATPLGQVGHPEQKPNYPGARSTPTVDGDVLFALGSDGDLVCLETGSGKEKWRKSLRGDFGGQYGEWAYAESPLVDGEKVICTPGGTDATMIALNKQTGEQIWKCPVPEGSAAGYSSAIRAELYGVKQYVQFLTSGLMGVHAETGKLLWRFEKTGKNSPAVIITPLVSDGMIYSGAFRATAALVGPVLESDGSFRVEEIYSASKLPYSTGGVVKVGDYFYGNGNQSALCVDFKTGDIQWEERALGPCAWLAADNRLYVHAESGEVGLIEPTAEGYREKGRFTPPGLPERVNQTEKAWAYPVIADGSLYIRDKGSLWRYDVKAGRDRS